MTTATHQTTSPCIQLVSPAALDKLLPELVELLRDTVNGGASLGFLPPISRDESRNYWLSLRPELQAGSRILLAACGEHRLEGTVQLALSPWPNARHRAELQKLFVSPALRGRGLGKSLMAAAHTTALQLGRTLLSLTTRWGGPAEVFYKELGYRQVGVIPGWTVGPAGERYDHVTLYRELSS